jgi:hypothetical protein
MVKGRRIWSAWFGPSLLGAQLAWEAQSVMALRLMRLGLGGAQAHSEAQRMVREKIAALMEAQSAAATAALTSADNRRIVKKVMSVYQRRVRRNRRRLVG